MFTFNADQMSTQLASCSKDQINLSKFEKRRQSSINSS